MKRALNILFVIVLFVQVCPANPTKESAEKSDEDIKSIKEGQEDNKLYNCLKKDSFTISSAYFGYYTNKQLVNINIEFLRASNRVYNVLNLKERKWFIRWPAWLFLNSINMQASTAFHEAGHALRLKAAGRNYAFTLNRGGGGERTKNIIVYYLKQMSFQGFGGACLFDNFEYKYKNISNEDKNDLEIIISAGGLNNEMLLAESISYDMYASKYWTGLSWYLYLNKCLAGAGYEAIIALEEEKLSHDPIAIIKAFNAKGKNDFKKGTITKANWISTLLSATTYSIFIEKSLVLCGFRLPDFFSYITTEGMSYKMVTGYEVDEDTRLLFGFESVFEKYIDTEYSIGIDSIAKLQIPINYKCIFTFGSGLDLEASVTVPVSSWFSVGLGLEYWSFSSLQGQRNITRNVLNVDGTSASIDRESESTNIFVSVSVRY